MTTKNITNRALLPGAAAIGSLLMTPHAWAQTESPPTENQQSEGPLELEEVIVTADRAGTEAVQVGSFRGARQLDVPLTVSVIPIALIEQQQSQSVYDALRNSAGVSVSQISSTVYSNLAIRGIDVENRGNYRLNGTLPIINIVGLPLENKERVEALKGASALYYGFTTPSGIINLVMKRPTEEQTLNTKLFGSSTGSGGGAVDYGNTWGPFGARLNGVYAVIDSGIDNTEGHRSLISGAFDYKPTDKLTFTFDVERIFTKAGEPPTYRFNTKPATTVANPNPTVTLPPFRDNDLNFGPGDWVQTKGSETNLLFAARYKLSRAWELSASAGESDFTRYRKSGFIDVGRPLGNDNYTLTIGNAPREVNYNRNYRAELAGTFALGPVVNNVLIGASENIRDRENPLTINATFTQNIANPMEFPDVPFAAPNYGPGDNRKVRVDDIGYYVFDRISFGQWVDILGGVRASDYTESLLVGRTDTFHATPTSISYGAIVKPVRWASVYATYIEGLEATPLAPTTAVNAGASLPPTDSEQYEAGIKVEPRPGILLQAAYFDIQRAATFVNSQNVYVIDGEQSYKGTELSATGKIIPELTVYATALFLDTEYSKGAPTTLLFNANGTPRLDPASGSQLQATTIVGNRVDNAPRRTWSLAADYTLDKLLPGLSVNAAAYYVGERALNAQNLAIVPGYTVYNLGAGYTTELFTNPTQFRLSWENVGDKEYWATSGLDFLAQGLPSAVKLTISVDL